MSLEISPLNEGFPSLYDSLTKRLSHTNSIVLFAITGAIIFFYILSNYLGISSDMVGYPEKEEKGTGIYIIETLMWAILIFLILINGLQYFFELDIKATAHDILSEEPKIDIQVKGEKKEKVPGAQPEITLKKQVYHIPGNEYTYEDAKAICTAHGDRLANQHEINSAYRDGAEWCSYGWSEDQLALFPTQESTWFKLKKMKGHEHDCGRPGINGGYIGNPNAKFGVNCYGFKPNIKSIDSEYMSDIRIMPTSDENKKMNEKIENYKKRLTNMVVAPFNKNRWSQI